MTALGERKIYDQEIKPKIVMNKKGYRDNQDSTCIKSFLYLS